MIFRFTLSAMIALLAFAGPVAAEQTFFGEDLGAGENVRLLLHPNSDAARALFISNLLSSGTEDFESFADDTPNPLAITFPGEGTATMLGNGKISNVPAGTDTVGNFPISGDNLWVLQPGVPLSIAFDQPVSAFGFYATDIGDFGGQVTLNLVNGGDKLLTIPNTINGVGGSVIYFGVIDTADPFNNITFGNTAAGVDFFGLDDLTIGTVEQDPGPVEPDPEPNGDPTVVPEPSTFILFGSAIAAAFLRKKK